MDLHLSAAQATDSEKAAIDAVLAAREPGDALLERPEPRSRQHLLLPVLHAIQDRAGWISPGALNYAAFKLDVAPAEVHGVASFYGMFSLVERPAVVAHICDDIACLARGAERL